MKARVIIAPVLSAFLLCIFSSDASADTAESPKTKPVLERGMEASTIIQSYGQPDKIQPLENPEGKAEKWIYRRTAKDTTVQTASDVTMIPAYIGFSGTGGPIIADTPVLDYKLKHIRIYQVTALMLIDDKLVLGRQWTEREERFTN